MTVRQAEAFDALGNAVRRDILHMLAQRPMAVAEIAKQVPVSRPAISRHLIQLQKAGLVSFEAHGTRHLYQLNRAGFDRATAWLNGFWDDALTRFKMVAENTAEGGS